MSWFRSRKPSDARATPTASLVDSQHADDGTPEEVHLSPALAEVLGEIPPESALHVLDLGPAVGENLTFLSERFQCRLQVADLFRSAMAAGQPFTDPDADPQRLFRDLLPIDDAEPKTVDLVLAWDLLDYLRRDQVDALVDRLAKLCPRGGLIYALVHIGKEVPREPQTYLLRDEGELLYRGPSEPTRPGTRYKPAEIDAMTPGFTVDRTYLLRHGVQEYLLERNAAITEAPPDGPSGRSVGRAR